MASPSAGLASDFEACYRDLVRKLAQRTGCPDRARELAHDTWLKLAGSAPGAAEVQCARAYLFGAAQNLAIDHARRRARHDTMLGDLALRASASAPDAADQVAHRQALQAVEQALQALPQRTRNAFLAHRLDGTGHDALAALHGVSRSTIERDLQRAQRAVQAAIAHWHGRAARPVSTAPPLTLACGCCRRRCRCGCRPHPMAH